MPSIYLYNLIEKRKNEINQLDPYTFLYEYLRAHHYFDTSPSNMSYIATSFFPFQLIQV